MDTNDGNIIKYTKYSILKKQIIIRCKNYIVIRHKTIRLFVIRDIS